MAGNLEEVAANKEDALDQERTPLKVPGNAKGEELFKCVIRAKIHFQPSPVDHHFK